MNAQQRQVTAACTLHVETDMDDSDRRIKQFKGALRFDMPTWNWTESRLCNNPDDTIYVISGKVEQAEGWVEDFLSSFLDRLRTVTSQLHFKCRIQYEWTVKIEGKFDAE